MLFDGSATCKIVSSRRVLQLAVRVLATFWLGLSPFKSASVGAPFSPDTNLPIPVNRTVDFLKEVKPIFEKHCFECHDAAKQRSGFRLDQKTAALKGGENHAPDIIPGKSSESPLIHFVAGLVSNMTMPQRGERLSEDEIGVLRAWIDQGAIWPDDKPAEEHWAFKRIDVPTIPTARQKTWARNPIDFFVLASLEQKYLSPSKEADRRTLIRRLYYDVLGLPPSPQEVKAFLSDRRPNAYENLVDQILASPHYGERWARHWLDVVRFAETTGFEVNTPRNNAWPYRDYVIRAFNEDKPYNQFILEQLAGDAFGVEEATGFLVGGPNDQVKSPDIVLTRQQRSDELHDMVSTTGSAFLGLTVGCARCHSHKFDPISQVDYYAMTAVFSGVQHGERQLKVSDAEARLQQAKELRNVVNKIEGDLTEFEPLAKPNRPPQKQPNHEKNEETFDTIVTKVVRFTIHETERHPTIGEIEPCIDELEIFSAGENPHNVALASLGARASVSGTYKNVEFHKREHINDGKYGNSRSWISSENGVGWIQIELPHSTAINRIIWGRDREGKFKDRLPISYTIEAQVDGRWKRIAGTPSLRPAVHPRQNVERFEPVLAKFVRFTVLETSGLEPCVDELEIFSSGDKPRNIALASLGAKATASSVFPNAAIHKLEHINDGLYGNNHSWISSEAGKGWVQIELPEVQAISKVVWGRDREEKFADRLATKYRIEVATDTNSWSVVADSTDRHRYVPGQKSFPLDSMESLTGDQHTRLRSLLDERTKLERKITELTTFPVVYAGTFSAPQPAFRLHRGDPMQQREEVAPGALSSFPPKIQIANNATEQERRLELGRWIASPENPLTARVIVNRLWQHHFGEGLVGTPSDFGVNGARPTHPELLDWLALELIKNDWKLKPIHRLMLLSSTYRQSSDTNKKAETIDAGNRLLWRYTPRRLEAEPLRDAILSMSGKLDLKMGGPGYQVFEPNDNYVRVYEPKKDFGPTEWRRMIYQFKPRMQQDATFGVFDCPDGGQIAPRRSSSTTPLQALNLLNSNFMMQQAKFFAERLQNEESRRNGQIRRAFLLAFNREPTRNEIRASEKLIANEGLASFCRAMLNANEFLYVY